VLGDFVDADPGSGFELAAENPVFEDLISLFGEVSLFECWVRGFRKRGTARPGGLGHR
jgi:hypothetical protein